MDCKTDHVNYFVSLFNFSELGLGSEDTFNISTVSLFLPSIGLVKVVLANSASLSSLDTLIETVLANLTHAH